MKVISINIGQPREVEWHGQIVRTSIFKAPVTGRIGVSRLHLDGDAQADLVAHGGEHRAVMVYQKESYEYWRKTLRREDLGYGQFGENLTVEGLADSEVCIGDRFLIGSAIFEVTQPRVTCFKVSISTGIAEMPALLVQHKRPGFYFRVIREGEVGAGDTIQKIRAGGVKMSVAEIDGLLYLKDHPKKKLEKALKIQALSQGWKGSFQQLLDAELAGTKNGNAGLNGVTLPTAWSGFRPFVVQNVRMESENIRSFELAAQDLEHAPSFLPGQHIAVKITNTGSNIPLIRMYSLCGAPKANTLRIAVKREANGEGSRFMHERVNQGAILQISAPRGSFTLVKGKSPLILLSAGVGITPLLSMLHAVADQDASRQIWWIQSSRNGAQRAFRAEVSSLAKRLSAFQRFIIYSVPDQHDCAGADYDIRGHLDLQVLQELKLPSEGEFYLCGPPKYLESTLIALKALGITENQIKFEIFGGQENQSVLTGKAPHLPADDTGKGPLVTFGKSKVSFRWNSSFKSLLEAAEACGVPVKWSCRNGVCHRCETSMLDGKVTYSISPLDPAAAGNVLVCCSAPLEDVYLDL